MKQFNLEEYLKNPSRKVVTRDGRAVKIYSFTENKEIQYISSRGYSLECLKIDEHRILFSDYYLPIFDDRTNSFTNLSTTSTNILRFDDNKEIIEFNNDKYFCRFDGKIYRVNNEFTELKNKVREVQQEYEKKNV